MKFKNHTRTIYNRIFLICLGLFFATWLASCSKTPHVFMVVTPVKKQDITITPATENANWTMAYEKSDGTSQNYLFSGKITKNKIKQIWRANIGSGASSDERLLNPVVYGDTVYAVDSNYRITAVKFSTGKILWRFKPNVPSESSDSIGGGLAFYNGILYMSTGYGHVYAFDVTTHKLLWDKDYTYPFRSAPTIVDNKLYIQQDGDRVVSIDGTSGNVLWTHGSFGSSLKILGGSAPTVRDNIVFFGNSQGSIIGLSGLNGRRLLGVNVKAVETMFSLQSKPMMPYNFLNSVQDVHSAVILTPTSFIGDSVVGNLSSINNVSATPYWSLQLGTYNNILQIGNMLYVFDTKRMLWALNYTDGTVRWKDSFPAWDYAKKHKGAVVWSGPIMAKSMLWFVSSDGEIVAVDAKTGKITVKQKQSSVFRQAPIFVKGSMLVFAEDGYLYKF